jgi:hypothetical protein
MKPAQRSKPIRVRVVSDAREEIDPEALWFDEDVEAEDLMRLDPLYLEELEQLAEQPELENPIIQRLPEFGEGALRRWTAKWRIYREELQEQHGNAETGEELQARIRGSK